MLLKRGYYRTKGGHCARLDSDILVSGLGTIRGVGFVAYLANGEFAHKDSAYENHPGDSLDICPETWQLIPFGTQQGRTAYQSPF